MASPMRAKLTVTQVTRHQGSDVIEFKPVYDLSYDKDGLSEDSTFSKFSPHAELKITVTNPALIGKYSPGEVYYVDFTPCPTAGG